MSDDRGTMWDMIWAATVVTVSEEDIMSDARTDAEAALLDGLALPMRWAMMIKKQARAWVIAELEALADDKCLCIPAFSQPDGYPHKDVLCEIHNRIAELRREP